MANGTAEPRSVPGAESRLATYGTLAPGRENHHQLAGLRGTWRAGTVRGRMAASGWAVAMGYKALIPDPAGPVVEVQIFESSDLPDHWARLDDFEGEEYQRVVVPVATDDGEVEAYIYVMASDG